MYRSKRSILNIIAAVLNNMIKVLIPFITRTLIIYRLGEEYTGLGGLFTSILSILSVTELGFSTAVTYLMYEPMSRMQQTDIYRINSLLNFIRRTYLIVGCMITICGVCICPFLQFIIKGDVPNDVNVVILYMIYLLNTVLGYFFGGYCRTAFYADQRNDIVSNIESIIYILTSVVQIVILLLVRNFYFYVIWIPIGTFFTNIVIRRYAQSYFPSIYPNGELDEKEKGMIVTKVKALFIGSIGTVIFSSSDNIIISSFIGLNMITIYGNYYYIANFLFSLTYSAFGAITSVVANKINSSSTDETEVLFHTIHFWVCQVSGIFCTGYFLLIQEFMNIWMGNKRILGYSTILLICVLIYLLQFRRASIVFFDAQGLWNYMQYAPLLAGIVNLLSNIILVQCIGINGIVLSTILSLVIISIPRELYVLYKYYFKKKVLTFLIANVKYLCSVMFSTIVSYFIINLFGIDGILGFIIRGISIVAVSCVIDYMLWHKSVYFTKGIKMFRSAFIKRNC